VGKAELLDDLINANKTNFSTMLINEENASKLENYAFVDFRDKAQYDSGHIKGARHVDHADMFSKPMMEELNKSNSLIIIHDVPEVAGTIAMTLKLMNYPSIYILQ